MAHNTSDVFSGERMMSVWRSFGQCPKRKFNLWSSECAYSVFLFESI